ncbi:unnamed protein product, partial [Iphiclides podalirius]
MSLVIATPKLDNKCTLGIRRCFCNKYSCGVGEWGGSGRAAESRARGGRGRGGEGGRGCCAADAQINISRCRGDAVPDRVPPVLHPRTPTPHLPTTRLFNTCPIWDGSFFMLNDRAA